MQCACTMIIIAYSTVDSKAAPWKTSRGSLVLKLQRKLWTIPLSAETSSRNPKPFNGLLQGWTGFQGKELSPDSSGDIWIWIIKWTEIETRNQPHWLGSKGSSRYSAPSPKDGVPCLVLGGQRGGITLKSNWVCTLYLPGETEAQWRVWWYRFSQMVPEATLILNKHSSLTRLNCFQHSLALLHSGNHTSLKANGDTYPKMNLPKHFFWNVGLS